MTYFMGRPTGPPQGLIFQMSIAHHGLRKGCFEKNGRFHSVLKWKGNKINLGVFGTRGECNDTWDRAHKRREIKERKPARKGYTQATIGNMQRVNLFIKGENCYIGTFECKDEARAAYLKAFDKETQRQLDELD